MFKRHVVFVLIGVIFLMASGCGGGGGGGGRYTLPGEVTPTPTPTGGGGGGGTGGETNPDAIITSGWEDFKLGSYDSAISKFNQLLLQTNLTDAQKAEAYNGLGWAQAKTTGLESAANSFSQAIKGPVPLNEARVGLAAVYMQRSTTAEISQAISLFEAVGLGDTSFRFTSTHPIGVSNAEAHAMLAFCYHWRSNVSLNDPAKAVAQINVARQEDPASDGSVGQIYSIITNPTWKINHRALFE
jgi:tetratricopeptide (TPR) repeat protein